jgi:signal-transduction protein with cAMP-binding, CBS, and nucleotidyltransferase domain
MHSQTELFRRTVADRMRPPPLTLPATTPVGAALARMSAAKSPAILVTDPAERVQGIVTEQDVVRRIAWQVSPEERIETVMSAPVVTVRAGDHLLQAIAVMRRRRLSQVPVVDPDLRAKGLLVLVDALLALAGPTLRHIELLTGDESIDGLRAAKTAQVELADALLRDEVPVPEVQSLLSDLNADLHRRVLAHVATRLEADGWGAPPAAFSLIVMGSGGRGENFLAPDQDNGFILDDYPDSEHARIDGYFLALAQRMTEALDRVGFELCKGNVMATNPVWRKRISEWLAQVDMWMRRKRDMHLLAADILFDFRHVHGEPALSERLRQHLTAAARANPQFLGALYRIEADHRVALGWFGGLAKERDDLNRPGMINLKLHGTLPLVEGVRLHALRHGIAETSTLARLDALKATGAIGGEDHDYLVGAFHFITRLLLRQQVEDFRHGTRIADYVAEQSLSKRERDYLVSCFRAIQDWRQVLGEEFTR